MGGDHIFEKDNAFMLSQFEEIIGKIEQLKAQNRSQKNQIVGLNFKNENLTSEIKVLKKNNAILKEEIKELKGKLENDSRLIPQNFKIRNKIIKIVSDIEDKESADQPNLKDLLEMLIEEIDFCINQLANK